MTIDERLERLTERHEALTQTVELMAIENRQNSDNILKLLEIAQIHERRLERLEDRP